MNTTAGTEATATESITFQAIDPRQKAFTPSEYLEAHEVSFEEFQDQFHEHAHQVAKDVFADMFREDTFRERDGFWQGHEASIRRIREQLLRIHQADSAEQLLSEHDPENEEFFKLDHWIPVCPTASCDPEALNDTMDFLIRKAKEARK